MTFRRWKRCGRASPLGWPELRKWLKAERSAAEAVFTAMLLRGNVDDCLVAVAIPEVSHYVRLVSTIQKVLPQERLGFFVISIHGAVRAWDEWERHQTRWTRWTAHRCPMSRTTTRSRSARRSRWQQMIERRELGFTTFIG